MQQQQHAESTIAIPLQILQLAEAQYMGMRLAIYPRKYRAYPVSIAISIPLSVGVAAIAIPLTILPWSYYLLLLALLGIVLYLLLKRAEIVHRWDQVVLYDEGFIFFNKGLATAYRWENIQNILRGLPPGEGQSSGDIDRITVRTETTIFKLDGSMPTHARATICDHIEHGFVAARLPRVIAQYNAGEEISFGMPLANLEVSQAGIRDSTELLPWSMVEKAEVQSSLVTIRKEGRTSDWYSKLTCSVPNAALLKALFAHLQYNR